MDSCDPFILVLSGHLELRRTIDLGVMEDFAQRLDLRYLIPPLSPAETADLHAIHLLLRLVDTASRASGMRTVFVGGCTGCRGNVLLS